MVGKLKMIKLKGIYPPLKFLTYTIINILIAYIVFGICRLVFFISNIEYFPNVEIGNIIPIIKIRTQIKAIIPTRIKDFVRTEDRSSFDLTSMSLFIMVEFPVMFAVMFSLDDIENEIVFDMKIIIR